MTFSFKKLLTASAAGVLALSLAACTPSLPGAPTDPNGPGVSGPGPDNGNNTGGNTGNNGGSAPDANTARGQIAQTLETFYETLFNELDENSFSQLENIGEPTTPQEIVEALRMFEQAFPSKLTDLVDSQSASPEDRVAFWSMNFLVAMFGQLGKAFAGIDTVDYTVDASRIIVNGNTAIVPGSAVTSNMSGGESAEQDDIELVFTGGRWKLKIPAGMAEALEELGNQFTG